MLGDETEVSAPWLDVLGLGFEFGTRLMEIDFLRAESKGVAAWVKVWVSGAHPAWIGLLRIWSCREEGSERGS